MNFIDKIKTDMYLAMKEGAQYKSTVLRSTLAKLKDAEINNKKPISDNQCISIIKTMIKQRTESFNLYLKGNRKDLAKIEKKEYEILESYIPKTMSENEIKEIVLEAIKNSNATKINEIGKVMSSVMKNGGSQIDGRIANKLAQELLS
tara:strand:- start:1160 stop:1603 length:444 start_codon:yes stop_codon:yes gene_type:complete